MFGVKPGVGLAQVLDGNVAFDDAVVEVRENLSLLAGGFMLVETKKTIDRKDFGGEQTLLRALQSHDSDFDYVILDTAPGYDALSVNALFYAEEAIIPVSMAALSIKGLLDFAQRLARIGGSDHAIRHIYILPTFLSTSLQHSRDILGLLENSFSKHVCTPIRSCVQVLEASAHGRSLFEYAPNSDGAHDYKRFIERIVADEQQRAS
jgi:chromosome partitioning protein